MLQADTRSHALQPAAAHSQPAGWMTASHAQHAASHSRRWSPQAGRRSSVTHGIGTITDIPSQSYDLYICR